MIIPFLSAEGFPCDPPTSGPGPRGEFLGCRTEQAGVQGETDRGETVRPGPHGSWPLRCLSEVLGRGRWWIGTWQINTSVLYRESKATLERGIPVGTKAGE